MTVDALAAGEVDPEPAPDPAPEVEAPFPTPPARAAAAIGRVLDRWRNDPVRILEAAISLLAVGLGTGIVLAALHPSDLLSNTTATGGDMGSHVWGPRFLIDHLLPHGRLSGWTPDWYSGFPAYQFYMVVPSLFVVLLHVGLPWYLAVPAVVAAGAVALSGWWFPKLYRYRHALLLVGVLLAIASVPLSYNRSFKLVTALGLLTLPAACWFLAKAAELPFPTPPLAAIGGLVFIFNQEPNYNNTGNIIGGNFQSTMAGEFCFSISLTFAVLYLGVAVKGLRTGRHRALAAVLFAFAGLCHLIPAFFVLALTGALFLLHPDRSRFKWLATMVPVAGLLTAFWVVPFVLRADYVNDMGWERLPAVTGEVTSLRFYLLPGTLAVLIALAVVGVVVSLLRRYAVGLALGLAWLAVVVAFSFLPQLRLWNARLLPFMYLSWALLAAIGAAELLRRPLAQAVVAGWLGVEGALWTFGARPLWTLDTPFIGLHVPGTDLDLPTSLHLPMAVLLAVCAVEAVLLALRLVDGVAWQPAALSPRAATCAVAVLAVGGGLVYAALPLDGLFPGHVEREAVTDPVTNQAKTRSSWLWFSTTAQNHAPGWSANNYHGLEEKPAVPAGCDAAGSTTACTSGGWKEFRHLVQTMAGIGATPKYGCGRAFWEYDDAREGGYGTPMALMMLPFFTNGCIGSQEGLYFESSTTVPYHFLMQAELSTRGSNPQRELVYPTFDIDTGVKHLQMLGVRYYLADTVSAVDQASRHPDLTEIAVSGPWHVYLVADSDPVAPLTMEPVVAEGLGNDQWGWMPTSTAWFGRPDLFDVPLARSGPAGWKRVELDPVPEEWRRVTTFARQRLGKYDTIDRVPALPRTRLPKITVSDIEMGTDTISFRVSEPGVPVLVKTSYFPNWQVSGAKGPYRVTPNLMVVIPTDRNVSMHYGRTPVDWLGIALTVLGLVALVLLVRAGPMAVSTIERTRFTRWLEARLAVPADAGPGPGPGAAEGEPAGSLDAAGSLEAAEPPDPPDPPDAPDPTDGADRAGPAEPGGSDESIWSSDDGPGRPDGSA